MVANLYNDGIAPPPEPSPDEVDQALQAFWHGSPGEFDRLLDDGGPNICTLLAGLVYESGRRRSSLKTGFRILRSYRSR